MDKNVPEWRDGVDGWKALYMVFEAVGSPKPAPGSVFQMSHLYPLMDWIMERKDG